MIQQMQMRCDMCKGRRKIISRTCEACGGSKVELSAHSVELVIERGMKEDDAIEYEEQWDITHSATIPGTIVFRVSTVEHATFVRDDNDLHTTISITLKEALLGFQRTLRALDDHDIHVKRTSITKPGSIIRIANEGMPIRDTVSEFGNLHIKVVVIFPQQLNSYQRTEIRRLLT
uniref:Chaperone DnaJ C-terminal domain-containing protein n=1 Tax=Lygus hesperus TaxID=30085 RepID=A0A0A9XBM3_LYGHE